MSLKMTNSQIDNALSKMGSVSVLFTLVLGVLTFFTVMPGIDLAAFYWLKPTTFLQKAIFIGIGLITFYPMFVLAMVLSVLVVSFLVAVFS